MSEVPLKGPSRRRFLMSEVPLYSGGAELFRLVLWRIHVPGIGLL